MGWFGTKNKKAKTNPEKNYKDYYQKHRSTGRRKKQKNSKRPCPKTPQKQPFNVRRRVPLEFTLRRNSEIAEGNYLKFDRHKTSQIPLNNENPKNFTTPYLPPSRHSTFYDSIGLSTVLDNSKYSVNTESNQLPVKKVNDVNEVKEQTAEQKKVPIYKKKTIRHHKISKTRKHSHKDDSLKPHEKETVEFLKSHINTSPEILLSLFKYQSGPCNTHEASDKAGDKCRFDDIHCYDSSRVVLKAENDFIHANKVYLPDQKEFILTQKPMEKTVHDFWNMIWQEKPHVVLVILTEDEMRKERVQLLPQTGAFYFGDGILVNLQLDSQPHDDLKLTVLGLSKDRQKRQVRWLHYSSWEHDQLPNPKRLWEIQSYIRKSNMPIVIMSQSGVGRAGSYFFFELLHHQLHNHNEEALNLEKSVSYIRAQRHAALQSAIQIDFITNMMTKHFKRIKNGADRIKTDDESYERGV